MFDIDLFDNPPSVVPLAERRSSAWRWLWCLFQRAHVAAASTSLHRRHRRRGETADLSTVQETLFQRPASPVAVPGKHAAAAFAMTVISTIIAAGSGFVSLLPVVGRHHCRAGEHLVTVVSTRRVREALGKRYWIRCWSCDVEVGPYRSWRVAWAEAFRLQIEARRGVSREPAPTYPQITSRDDDRQST